MVRTEDEMWEGVAGAGLALLPFSLAVLFLMIVLPPTAAQRQAADPLIRSLEAWNAMWLLPTLCILLPLALVFIFPQRPNVRRLFFGGAAAAAATVLTLRLFVGPTLPPFIPPEESARAGLTLGLAAGVLEETVFRLLVLPLAWCIAARCLSAERAALPAILVTGLLFSTSHILGPGGDPFELGHFLTRSIVPGLFMSALFFRPGPAFVVTMHSTTHVLLPFCFV